MSEIQKELRLPSWATSWNQVVANIQSDDDLRALYKSGTNAVFLNQSWSVDPTDSFVERFEFDVNTLKMRAFDELHEIMPDKEILVKMMNDARATDYYHRESHETPLIKFLDTLFNTLY